MTSAASENAPSSTNDSAAPSVSFFLSTLQDWTHCLDSSSLSRRHQLREDARFAPDVVGKSASNSARMPDEDVLYDVIWAQWMLQHLSDEDLIRFLQAAKASLVKPDTSSTTPKGSSKGAVLDGSGCIFIKENTCQEKENGDGNVWFDEEDKSITRSVRTMLPVRTLQIENKLKSTVICSRRSRKAFERVFATAGLKIIKTEVQLGLPAELFAVRM